MVLEVWVLSCVCWFGVGVKFVDVLISLYCVGFLLWFEMCWKVWGL